MTCRIEVVTEHRHPSRKRLGRHIEHDDRSRAFEVPHLPGPLTSVEWHRHGPVFDQGAVGSCTGNAMAGLLMTGDFYEPGRELGEFDAVQIYSDATKVDDISGEYPPEDTGSSGLAVCKIAKKRGFIDSYFHAFSFAGALWALSKGPVLIGINWYTGFDEPQGSHAELFISGSRRGGHELFLSVLDVENGYVHGWNSWGHGWGNEGMFCMSFKTLKRILRDDGDCTVPQKKVV